MQRKKLMLTLYSLGFWYMHCYSLTSSLVISFVSMSGWGGSAVGVGVGAGSGSSFGFP